MTLLIKKNCSFCKDVEAAEELNNNVKKLYVEDGYVIVDDQKIPLDKRITALPALIDYEKNVVLIGSEYIIKYLKTGEV